MHQTSLHSAAVYRDCNASNQSKTKLNPSPILLKFWLKNCNAIKMDEAYPMAKKTF